MTNGNDEKTLLRAAWVAPMDGPPIRDGAIVFQNGRILDVGPADEVVARHPDGFHETPFEEGLITPGLVNAHTHLELSLQTAGSSPESFADWVIALIGSLSGQQFHDGRAAVEGTRAGIVQCLKFGVTTVGDITSTLNPSRLMIAGYSPLGAVSFGEVRGMGRRREQADHQLRRALDAVSDQSERFRLGVSPHAPYSVEPDVYHRCLEAAKLKNAPISTHLAETPDEAAFIRDHSGPLRRIWDFLGGLDDDVSTFDGGPIRFAKSLGLFDTPTVLAHVNYCDDEELSLLAGGRASVAYCPRTHAYFGHKPHRWREMLDRGINVCLGTDSCASSPDLNLLDDVRLLHRIAPEVPAATLWEMATICGARALNMDGRVGTLTPGKRADLILFTVKGDDPLTAALESDVTPFAVYIGGRRVSHLAVGELPAD